MDDRRTNPWLGRVSLLRAWAGNARKRELEVTRESDSPIDSVGEAAGRGDERQRTLAKVRDLWRHKRDKMAFIPKSNL
jgi:hypothetical protein